MLSKYGLDCQKNNTNFAKVTWETCTLRTSSGNETQDQMFLLSVDEVNRYFSSDMLRACKPTDYVKEQGAYVEENFSARCPYWLRTPGISRSDATFVFVEGSVSEKGNPVNAEECTIRPAMWIYLSDNIK